MSRPLSFALLPLVLLAACAPSVAKDETTGRADTGRRCVFIDSIQGYTVKDDTLYLRAGRLVYQLETAGFCPGVDSGIALGFKPNLGSGQVCVGDWIDVVVPSPSASAIPCRAKVEKIMTAEDIAALPKTLQP